MSSCRDKSKRRFTEAARESARIARAAKWAAPDDFGNPEMFVVRNSGNGFTWELRRFGGVVLERGSEVFADIEAAKGAGNEALAVLCRTPGLPKFERELRPKLSTVS